jgi:hypothetical protein
MRTRSSRQVAALLLALAALASALADTAPLQVTYYYLPG